MSAPKFTPGPWGVFVHDDSAEVNADDGIGQTVAVVTADYVTESGLEKLTAEGVANARLVGAAPELYATIEKFVRLSDAMAREWSDGDWRAVLKCVRDQTEEMRAALAKAGGK